MSNKNPIDLYVKIKFIHLVSLLTMMNIRSIFSEVKLQVLWGQMEPCLTAFSNIFTDLENKFPGRQGQELSQFFTLRRLGHNQLNCQRKPECSYLTHYTEGQLSAVNQIPTGGFPTTIEQKIMIQPVQLKLDTEFQINVR